MKKQIVFTSAMGQDIYRYEEGKTYVTSPGGAPKGTALKRGPRGGYYYEDPSKGNVPKEVQATRTKKTSDVKAKVKTLADEGKITPDEHKKYYAQKGKNDKPLWSPHTTTISVGDSVQVHLDDKTLKDAIVREFNPDGKVSVEYETPEGERKIGTYDRSQLSPGPKAIANKIMDISYSIMDKHGDTSGSAMKKPKQREELLKALQDEGITSISQEVADALENENYHTELEILREEGMIEKSPEPEGRDAYSREAEKQGLSGDDLVGYVEDRMDGLSSDDALFNIMDKAEGNR